MNLVAPLTPCLQEVLDDVLPLVEAVSFKSPGDEVFPGKACFLECSLNIAAFDFQSRVESEGILAALQSGKYTSFACDLGPNCERRIGTSENGFPRAFPLSKPLSNEAYLRLAKENVAWLRESFGGYLQLENNNYFPTGAYERTCEPDFISRVLDALDVNLLLDVAHAAISAHYLGYSDLWDYLASIPLERVREIQVSRAGPLNGIMEDLHEVPGPVEMELVDDLIRACPRARFLTIEYYRDPCKLRKAFREFHHHFGIAPMPNTSFR